MRVRSIAVFLSALLFAASGRASAQLTIGAGIGQGSGWPTCDGCDRISHRQGLTGYARIGAFLTPKIALSAEYNRWSNDESDASSQFQSLLGVAQLYVQQGTGFFLRVGGGVGGSLIRIKTSGTGELSSTGFSYAAGAGYDYPVTSQLVVSAFADFLGTLGAAESSTIGPASGTLNGNIMRFGIGLGWR